MFTGIVENLGVLQKNEPAGDGVVFTIYSELPAAHFTKGNSILVNGVCLTVETYDATAMAFTVTLVAETLARTMFKSAELGQKLNLETSLTLQKPLAGHLVLGHVDFTASVVKVAPALEIAIPAEFMKYFPEKGSVTVHGVSLTIAKRHEASIEMAIIPETIHSTNLGDLQIGDGVHVEIDMLARYLETLIPQK
ncbi:MAG: riboflavin synthase [Patescibacteria group bacterium]